MTGSIDASRRAVLAGAVGGAFLTAMTSTASALQTARLVGKFPKGFHWGTATAGHQIEGNNVNSDLWLMENIKPTAFPERSGDACDSYHRYEQDIALMARLGFNSYRFSIEWARIEPTPGQFSVAELDHYNAVIACCHRYGIAPAVTFFHVAAPRWFAEAGGWLNPDSPALFARYCSVAAKALADGMAFGFTLNEPQVSKTFRAISLAAAYFKKHDDLELLAHQAAAKATGSDRFATMNYPDIAGMTPLLIAAHAQGFAAIKAERTSLPVGVTLNVIDFAPGSADSAYKEIRQRAYGEWIDAVRTSGDFVGVQTYRQIRIPGKGKPFPALPAMPFVDPKDMQGNLSRPEALPNAIDYIYDETKKPIIVSENGLQSDNDAQRVWYIDAALSGLQQSIAKGVPVLGYFHWSLLDNFEWEQGYKPKFGLVAVDRTTFKRTPKPSAAHLGAIARRNAI